MRVTSETVRGTTKFVLETVDSIKAGALNCTMPTTKFDKKGSRRFLLWSAFNTVFMLSGMILVTMATIGVKHTNMAEWKRNSLEILSVVLIFAPVILTGWVFKRWQFSRYNCPNCGAGLPLTKVEQLKMNTISYYCKQCDVVWKMGSERDIFIKGIDKPK